MLFHGLDFFASVVILIFSLCELNNMGPKSNHVLRAADVFMAAGSFGMISGIVVQDMHIELSQSAVLVGLAIYLLGSRGHFAVELLREWWGGISSAHTVKK